MPEPDGFPFPGATAPLSSLPASTESIRQEAGERSRPGTGVESGRLGFLRSVVATVVAGSVIGGVVWFLDQPGGEAGSQAVALTAKAGGPAPKVGSPAPGFRLLALDGQAVELESFRGHPVWIT